MSVAAARHLVIVLGDQLDRQSAAFDGFDARLDRVWMAEVAGESTHVWTHKARIAVFLAAMRHFRDALRREGINVDYTELAARPATLPTRCVAGWPAGRVRRPRAALPKRCGSKG